MNILVIGAGHIGLVTAACLADAGHHVHCLAEDDDDIKALQQGQLEVHEPGLQEIISRCVKRSRLSISEWSGELPFQPEIIFLAVVCRHDTGEEDFQHALSWVERLATALDANCLLVNRSTLAPGSTQRLCEELNNELDSRKVKSKVDCAYYPEFMSEGTSVENFTQPEKVILGVTTTSASERLLSLLKPFYRNRKAPIVMSIASAELSKYATNAMLATRITFINEMARLCDSFGANISEVRKGLAIDPRIGSHFLIPGLGFAGTTFPKDISTLVESSKSSDSDFLILEAVERANQVQKTYLIERLDYLWKGDFQDKIVAIWGLSFKPRTKDISRAPSLNVVPELLKKGAIVKVFDPMAMERFADHFPGNVISYCQDELDAVLHADAVMLLTEWPELRAPDWQQVKGKMNSPLVLDGRNIYDKQMLNDLGFQYIGVGR